MNITYVKIRSGKVSVKDPILYLLRDILPNDKVRCVEISENMGFFKCRDLELAIHSHNPELIIGCGYSAEAILKHAHRYSILINPSISQEDLDLLFHDRKRVKILRTESTSEEITREYLSDNLIRVIDSLRQESRELVEHLDTLVQLAQSPTERMPKDFNPECNILENLKKHKETVDVSEHSCPNCGHQMIHFFVKSPECTWGAMCGIAGYLTYCPMCKNQHGFSLMYMN
jgi:hypothetical protein